VLRVAREEMVAEHARAIHPLTTLLRPIDLSVGGRKALLHGQFNDCRVA